MYRFSHILYAPSRILRAPARVSRPPRPHTQTQYTNLKTTIEYKHTTRHKRRLVRRPRPPRRISSPHTRARSTSTVAMGITFAKLFQRLFSKKEMRILMVRRPRLDATPRPRHGRNHRLERDGWDRREIAIWRR